MVEIKHWRSNNILPTSKTVTVERWTRYAHLSNDILVRVGDWVNTNQDIGKMGNTEAMSIHLHWEVRQLPYCSDEDGSTGWFYINLSRNQDVSRGQQIWVDDSFVP